MQRSRELLRTEAQPCPHRVLIMVLLKSSSLYLCLVLGVGVVLVFCLTSFKNTLADDGIGLSFDILMIEPDPTTSSSSAATNRSAGSSSTTLTNTSCQYQLVTKSTQAASRGLRSVHTDLSHAQETTIIRQSYILQNLLTKSTSLYL